VRAAISISWRPSAVRLRPPGAGRGGERRVLDHLVPVGGARRDIDQLEPLVWVAAVRAVHAVKLDLPQVVLVFNQSAAAIYGRYNPIPGANLNGPD
jgi:hypothetical protein